MNSHPHVDFLCLCFERAVTNQFENCTEQQRERHGGELLTCTAEHLGYWWVKTVCRHICHRHRQEARKEIAETSMSYLRVVGGGGGGGGTSSTTWKMLCSLDRSWESVVYCPCW